MAAERPNPATSNCKYYVNSKRMSPSDVQHHLCYLCGELYTDKHEYQKHIVQHQGFAMAYQMYHFSKTESERLEANDKKREEASKKQSKINEAAMKRNPRWAALERSHAQERRQFERQQQYENEMKAEIERQRRLEAARKRRETRKRLLEEHRAMASIKDQAVPVQKRKAPPPKKDVPPVRNRGDTKLGGETTGKETNQTKGKISATSNGKEHQGQQIVITGHKDARPICNPADISLFGEDTGKETNVVNLTKMQQPNSEIAISSNIKEHQGQQIASMEHNKVCNPADISLYCGETGKETNAAAVAQIQQSNVSSSSREHQGQQSAHMETRNVRPVTSPATIPLGGDGIVKEIELIDLTEDEQMDCEISSSSNTGQKDDQALRDIADNKQNSEVTGKETNQMDRVISPKSNIKEHQDQQVVHMGHENIRPICNPTDISLYGEATGKDSNVVDSTQVQQSNCGITFRSNSRIHQGQQIVNMGAKNARRICNPVNISQFGEDTRKEIELIDLTEDEPSSSRIFSYSNTKGHQNQQNATMEHSDVRPICNPADISLFSEDTGREANVVNFTQIQQSNNESTLSSNISKNQDQRIPNLERSGIRPNYNTTDISLFDEDPGREANLANNTKAEQSNCPTTSSTISDKHLRQQIVDMEFNGVRTICNPANISLCGADTGKGTNVFNVTQAEKSNCEAISSSAREEHLGQQIVDMERNDIRPIYNSASISLFGENNGEETNVLKVTQAEQSNCEITFSSNSEEHLGQQVVDMEHNDIRPICNPADIPFYGEDTEKEAHMIDRMEVEQLNCEISSSSASEEHLGQQIVNMDHNGVRPVCNPADISLFDDDIGKDGESTCSSISDEHLRQQFDYMEHNNIREIRNPADISLFGEDSETETSILDVFEVEQMDCETSSSSTSEEHLDLQDMNMEHNNIRPICNLVDVSLDGGNTEEGRNKADLIRTVQSNYKTTSTTVNKQHLGEQVVDMERTEHRAIYNPADISLFGDDTGSEAHMVHHNEVEQSNSEITCSSTSDEQLGEHIFDVHPLCNPADISLFDTEDTGKGTNVVDFTHAEQSSCEISSSSTNEEHQVQQVVDAHQLCNPADISLFDEDIGKETNTGDLNEVEQSNSQTTSSSVSEEHLDQQIVDMEANDNPEICDPANITLGGENTEKESHMADHKEAEQSNWESTSSSVSEEHLGQQGVNMENNDVHPVCNPADNTLGGEDLGEANVVEIIEVQQSTSSSINKEHSGQQIVDVQHHNAPLVRNPVAGEDPGREVIMVEVIEIEPSVEFIEIEPSAEVFELGVSDDIIEIGPMDEVIEVGSPDSEITFFSTSDGDQGEDDEQDSEYEP
ncbi:hypothetical protein Q1695_000644 [Nippostrongylus brasiliensis]|nr:hypothetical protein Q1695_000644 [Nippostrongylus brasiliensis]